MAIDMCGRPPVCGGLPGRPAPQPLTVIAAPVPKSRCPLKAPDCSRTGIAITVLMVALTSALHAEVSLQAALNRISEEAEAFRLNARNVIGREVLKHTGRKAPPRFRPRIGEAARQVTPGSYVTREIVSEYGYSTLKDNPDALHEFRKVVAVDGRQILRAETARTTLAINMRSGDDRERRRMLQEFEKHGTAGATTDFGLMLLLFHRRALPYYEFALGRSAYLGADPAVVIRYRQRPGSSGLNVYQGRELVRVPMEGEIWVRQRDLVPLRISMNVVTDVDERKAVHAAVVEYAPSARGTLLPASVRYTETVDNVMMTENLYQYSSFKFFTAETDIKFTPGAESPSK